MTAALVVAKAPVSGQAKTRLAATVGDRAAAEVAAAALLDTIEICAEAFDTCLLALAGDLGSAVRGPELLAHTEGWTVFPQRGDSFGERLAKAHLDAFGHTGGPVIQIGMDTPQVTARQLGVLRARLSGGEYDAVLGRAEDGGWWVLGVTDPTWLSGLAGLPMSSERTGADTLRLLQENGARVGLGPVLRDVDEAADADAVSEQFPDLGFSSQWLTTGALEGGTFGEEVG